MKMKKLYIFDCYGVVVNEVGNDWAARHGIKNDSEKYTKWRKIADQSDLGEISKDEVYQKTSKLANQTPQEFEREWTDSVKVNKDVIETIKKLRKADIKVVMLSNTSSFIQDFLEKVGADGIWDKKFLSYELGIKKPDPKIFQYVLDEMNIRAEDVCFIDDNEINLRSAETLGIQTVLYPSEEFSKII